jgi:photosystem II stability/assembly factor-like uncharacterized protein
MWPVPKRTAQLLGRYSTLGIFLTVLVLAAAALAQPSAEKISTSSSPWQMQNSTTKAGLRGIHAVGGGVAWASGTNGTVLRTEDDGYIWQLCATPPGAEKLDFRGVWAWDANVAVAMSSGPGELSRLYKTTDGCSSWKLLYTNPDKDGFWDALVFAFPNLGYLLGDPVNGEFKVIRITVDDHGSFSHADMAGPKVDPTKLGAFAASNSSIAFVATPTPGMVRTWIGAGGKGGAIVFGGYLNTPVCTTCGQTVPDPVSVPLASGNESSGVFSLAFRDKDHGVAVGGDYKKPDESAGTAAYTSDGGKTWTAAAKPPHGYRSAVAWDAADKVWITVGTNGSDVSSDDGKTWAFFDSGKWNALSLPWGVGPEGRIGKLVSLKLVESGKK